IRRTQQRSSLAQIHTNQLAGRESEAGRAVKFQMSRRLVDEFMFFTASTICSQRVVGRTRSPSEWNLADNSCQVSGFSGSPFGKRTNFSKRLPLVIKTETRAGHSTGKFFSIRISFCRTTFLIHFLISGEWKLSPLN